DQLLINSWIEKLKHKVARKCKMENRSYEEFQAALQKEIDTSNFENAEFIADDNIINTEKINDFTNGGVFWFPDLTVADST
ncbi:13694_t:CDS:2, partial [Racocetra fulgida]